MGALMAFVNLPEHISALSKVGRGLFATIENGNEI